MRAIVILALCAVVTALFTALVFLYRDRGRGMRVVTALAVRGAGWAAPSLTAALAVLLLLHSRAVGSIPQRLALVLPGTYGLALPVGFLAPDLTAGGRLLLLAGLLALGAALAIAAWTVPGRRMLPYWGRAADLLHTAVAITVVPLALQVLGVYHALRALAG